MSGDDYGHHPTGDLRDVKASQGEERGATPGDSFQPHQSDPDPPLWGRVHVGLSGTDEPWLAGHLHGGRGRGSRGDDGSAWWEAIPAKGKGSTLPAAR